MGVIYQGGSGIQGDALGVVFLKILLDLLDEQDLAPAGLGVLVKEGVPVRALPEGPGRQGPRV